MMIELSSVSYFGAFADEQLGKTSLVQHVIDTGDAMPIKQRTYRTSPRCKQEIDCQVDDMLQKGIIRETVSPWSSPVVLVKQKNGSFRFCVDLRKVNAVTRKGNFPMPLVSDTCLLYTSPSPRDLSTSRMPSSA